MKLVLAIIAIIAVCLFTISKLHDDGTMIRASMAEEYSVCTNVNACSDEDLAEMTDLLLEQDEYVLLKYYIVRLAAHFSKLHKS